MFDNDCAHCGNYECESGYDRCFTCLLDNDCEECKGTGISAVIPGNVATFEICPCEL